MINESDDEMKSQGVLRKHKPIQQRRDAVPDHLDDVDYEQLESHFRQKFEHEKRNQQSATTTTTSTRARATTKRKPPPPPPPSYEEEEEEGMNEEEIVKPQTRRRNPPPRKKQKPQQQASDEVGVYKSLLEQAMKSMMKQAQKPLTDAQIRRNAEAAARMKAYHNSKKEKRSVGGIQEPPTPSKTPEPAQTTVSNVPRELPRNHFLDLKRKKR